jgi:hypothetical protein
VITADWDKETDSESESAGRGAQSRHPDAILAAVLVLLKKHLVLTPAQYLAVVLWIMFTYCSALFRHSPILAFVSPVKRCAKTTSLALTAALSNRAVMVGDPTIASLFRLIDDFSPSLFIDELDQLIPRCKQLIGFLNSSHEKTGAKTLRVIDEIPMLFNTFGPKALGCIGGLPDTVQDRSIVILCRRKKPDEVVDPLPEKPEVEYRDIATEIGLWVFEHQEEIRQCIPKIPPGLNDRSADNWRPLFAIAEVLGEKWASMAREAAVAISRAADADSVDPAEQLLRDIKLVFDADPTVTEIVVEELHRQLLEINVLWPEFANGQGLSKTKIGLMLKPFGITSHVTRLAGSKTTKRVYVRADFADAFSRYCPADSPAAAPA